VNAEAMTDNRIALNSMLMNFYLP